MLLCFLSSRGRPSSIIHKSIPFRYKAHASPDGPTRTQRDVRLKLVLNGVARKRVQNGRSHSKPRLPITAQILYRIFEALSKHQSDDTVMIWAACAMCFFGFFRVGEIVVPSASAFQPHRHLTWDDVLVDSIGSPSLVKICLRVSKCDQFGRGIDVFVGKVQSSKICPVAAILSYMARRGPAPGPFFQSGEGKPLTKSSFITAVRAVLVEAGLDPTLYSGHSFRIGAATTASQMGVEDSTIKALGRWSSVAFLAYLRTPRQQLASLSTTLASNL